MDRFLPFAALLFLFSHLDQVTTQDTEVTFSLTVAGTDAYQYCSQFEMNNMPEGCMANMEQDDLYPTSATSLKIVAGGCGSDHHLYNLFDGGDTDDDTIYRLDLPLNPEETAQQILSTGFRDVTSFDICCDNLFFNDGDKIYVQNLDVSVNKITKLIFNSHGTIDHLEVSCNSKGYSIFYSIDTDGLYRIDMDGDDPVQLINYDNGEIITDMDYNAIIGLFAFGIGIEMYVWNYGPATTTFPIVFGPSQVWLTRTDIPLTSLSVGSRGGTPVIISSWDTTQALGPLRVTTSMTDTVSVTSVVTVANDIALCVDEADCSVGCSQCPCDDPKPNGYLDCCTGLCVPHNADDTNMEPYSCHCRTETVFPKEGCTAQNDIPPYPAECPLDLTGAVKCQYSDRTEPFYLYAISTFSSASIHAVDKKGKEVNIIRRKGFKIALSNTCSIGYRFVPARFGRGNQYGTYSFQTSLSVNGLGKEGVNSFPVVVQERNKAIISKFVTQSTAIGSSVCLRVLVHPCNKRRVRWMLNGNSIPKSNGKTKMTLDPVTEGHFGIYEVYFSGRLKSNRRAIFRLIESIGNVISCMAGLQSYNQEYCICPPGKTGRLCENTCPKGSFGSLGRCENTCSDVFGEDCEDCRGILFCLQDPLGCQCYPGFKLPSCSPCRRGFFGINCMEECTCGGDPCDAYDGTCL
ncbi:Tyrosine-protein kinase receptor Tie-1 [Holothuria leucospilota]|uniref:Tyrosine-protein kinase receptor Tie-1 n=1 Tax=Holothuria leucospilota TaxID=206669 RepID=A0A9Q1H7E1_HOLLE|nr:Tyrosine-protein kinase receptor Tie-1 [Holothuria leucospilota]